MTEAPKNNYEALVLALTLAISAPTEEKSAECVEIAESLAQNMSEASVMRAQREASA